MNKIRENDQGQEIPEMEPYYVDLDELVISTPAEGKTDKHDSVRSPMCANCQSRVPTQTNSLSTLVIISLMALFTSHAYLHFCMYNLQPSKWKCAFPSAAQRNQAACEQGRCGPNTLFAKNTNRDPLASNYAGIRSLISRGLILQN